MKTRLFILLIFLLAIVVRYYKLSELPGEWFGDISNVHEYVTEILTGRLPFYFFQSAGPIYFYLIIPIVKVVGSKYLGYKIASVLVSFICLSFIYLLAKEVLGRKFGLITMLITAVSFWHIVWSRIGNLQILVVAVSALSYCFLFRSLKRRGSENIIWATVIASSGLFIYPAAFVLPLTILIVYILGLLINGQLQNNKKAIFLALLSMMPAVILFGLVVLNQTDNFFQGYVGEKFNNSDRLGVIELFSRFINYVFQTLLIFHYRGDSIFRINVPNAPLVDRLSGAFMLIGIFTLLLKKQLATFAVLMISILMLILPAVLPTISESEVPNSSRIISVMPIILLLIGIGAKSSFEFIKNRNRINSIIFSVVFMVITFLNIKEYFIDYSLNLPNQNVSYSTVVSEYIDSLPQNTKVILTDCCWGDWGQPEPKAIYYSLNNNQGRFNIVRDKFTKTCKNIENSRNLVLIFRPDKEQVFERLRKCFKSQGIKKSHYFKGQKIFTSYYLPN